MKVYVSHGAGDGHRNVEWFVVTHPDTSTLDDQVETLRWAGRTVYELDAVPWQGRRS